MIDNEETIRARENYVFTTSLSGILRSGTLGITELPGIIKRAISRRPWESLYIVSTNKVVSFSSMRAWIEAMQPEGLGTTVDVIKALIKDDDEAMSLFIQETGPLKAPEGGAPKGNSNAVKNNIDNITVVFDKPKRQAGTSQSYLLSRIARDRPDLLPEIGKDKRFKSARAAAKEAGIPVAAQITLSKNLETTAKAIRAHYNADEIESLIEYLRGENNANS